MLDLPSSPDDKIRENIGAEEKLAERLQSLALVTGQRQVKKAVAGGKAKFVYIACDASTIYSEPLAALCRVSGTEYDESLTMKKLGKAAGIDTGAGAIAFIER